MLCPGAPTLGKRLAGLQSRAQPARATPAAAPAPSLPGPAMFGPLRVYVLDAPEHVAALVTLLRGSPAVALDLEGVSLGDDGGRLSLLTLVDSRDGAAVFLVDITTLQGLAFATPAADDDAWTLATLLGAPAPRKLMWDCRSDATALLHGHGVRLGGVDDLQLHHTAHRVCSGSVPSFVSGLGKVLDLAPAAVSGLGESDRRQMASIKAKAKRLFAPEMGGSYAVWDKRPLDNRLKAYATDAATFFALRASYADAVALAPEALEAATLRRLASVEAPPVAAGGDEQRQAARDARRLADGDLTAAVAAAAAARNPGAAPCVMFTRGRCDEGASCTFRH